MKSKSYATKSNIFFIVPICFIILAAPLFVDIPKAYSNELQFVDKTIEAGLSYRPSPSWGLSWGDLNQDGWEDLYVKNHNVFPPSLYLNLRNGMFEDITNQAGLNFVEDFHGASLGDFDNDGDTDIYQLCGARGYEYGTKTNFLFQNNAGGTSTDIAESAGVQDPLGRGRTPVWFDYSSGQMT